MVFLFSDMLLYARPHLLDMKANVARSVTSLLVLAFLSVTLTPLSYLTIGVMRVEGWFHS